MICYSQDFKDSIVKRYKEGRTLNSFSEKCGPSKVAIAIWAKQSQQVVVNGETKTVKDIKALEKRLAILEKENEILSRVA